MLGILFSIAYGISWWLLVGAVAWLVVKYGDAVNTAKMCQETCDSWERMHGQMRDQRNDLIGQIGAIRYAHKMDLKTIRDAAEINQRHHQEEFDAKLDRIRSAAQ